MKKTENLLALHTAEARQKLGIIRSCLLLALVAAALLSCASAPKAGAGKNALSLWNEGASSKAALVAYVEAVTDEKSPDFIPVEDRIATFDMDGTFVGEL